MNKKQTLPIGKNIRNIWICLLVIVIALILVLVCGEFSNRKTVIDELTKDAIEYGMKDYKISVRGKDDYGKYNVVIESEELEKLEYEDIYRIVYNVCSSDAEVVFISNGNTYTPDSSKLCKNGEVVYSPKSSKKCIECGSSASRVFTSPFSREIEWYCSSCYRELQRMLENLGIE